MSGHSKWSTIKHKKAINDAKRAGSFTKLSRDITIAAREGGDPEMNFKLRLAIERAKSFNVPNDNIEKAIKRGTGELKDGALIEEVVYEACGPEGIFLIIKALTDNKNRTLMEVKSALKRYQWKLANPGSVNWQFNLYGLPECSAAGPKGEELELILIEAGAEEYEITDEGCSVFFAPNRLKEAKEILEKAGLSINQADLAYRAKNFLEVSEKTLEQAEGVVDELSANDDVLAIYDNIKAM